MSHEERDVIDTLLTAHSKGDEGALQQLLQLLTESTAVQMSKAIEVVQMVKHDRSASKVVEGPTFNIAQLFADELDALREDPEFTRAKDALEILKSILLS